MSTTPGAPGSSADPEVVNLVHTIRDRFGVHGLRDAAALIAQEIDRVQAELDAAFAAAEESEGRQV